MPLTPGLVSFFDCFGFSRVFAFFGGPIETRAFLVVNMRLGVNPNQAMTPAGRGRFCCCLSARAF